MGSGGSSYTRPQGHRDGAAQVPMARQQRDQAIFKHQSLERKSVALATPFEMAHIKDRAVCVGDEATDENNLLALSPAMHKMFDGGGYRNGRPVGNAPTVFISVCPLEGYAFGSETRFPIMLSVECANKATFRYVRKRLNKGVRSQCLAFFCEVRVKNFRKFEAYIGWKYDRTMRANFGPRWRELARAGS